MRKFRSKEEDLVSVDNDHKLIMKLVEEYNSNWTTQKIDRKKKEVVTGEEDEDDLDVAVWEDVTLTDDKLALLRLGPGYTVTSKLDREEILTEDNVTMTKIYWSKRKVSSEE